MLITFMRIVSVLLTISAMLLAGRTFLDLLLFYRKAIRCTAAAEGEIISRTDVPDQSGSPGAGFLDMVACLKATGDEGNWTEEEKEEEEEEDDTEENRSVGFFDTIYTCTYNFGGKTYTETYFGSSDRSWQNSVGDKIAVHLDPDNPSCFFAEPEKSIRHMNAFSHAFIALLFLLFTLYMCSPGHAAKSSPADHTTDIQTVTEAELFYT